MKNRVLKGDSPILKNEAPNIAEEIVCIFEQTACQNNIDYEWTIKKRTGQIEDNKANTFFYFDTVPGTHLHNFKKNLFGKELENIQENSEEEKNLMEEVREYIKEICSLITTKYKDRIKKVIREIVLGNKSDEKSIPLKTIEVLTIDIADFSSVPEPQKHLLKIHKKPGTEINVDEITIFVQEKEEEGQDISTTVAIEKQIENPLFENIISIEKGRKFLNDVSLHFFVDYSLAEEIETVVKKE